MKTQKTKHTPKQQISKQPHKPTISDTLSGKKGFFILLGLLCALALFVFHDFIFFSKVYLYKDIGSDSINSWYPVLYHISNYIDHLGGFPGWSFYAGMGQNISGFMNGDPFTWLLCFANANNIAYFVGFIEALKLITAGIFFYLFLRQINISAYAAIVGAMCFAFSGYIVLGSGWYHLSAEAYQTAFLLFSIEKLLSKKWVYFPFAVALIGVTVSFNLYLFSVLMAIYVFVRLYDEYGWDKKIAITYGQMVALGALGIGLGAFLILPKVQIMLDSPRVSGDASYFSELLSSSILQWDGLLDNLTKIGRLFSNDMLGTGNYFAGAENYLEAPLFYAGLVSLILFPQLFPFLSKKKKWLLGIVFVCALLPFIFPFFRYAFWLFSGKYYRLLSFFFALVLMMYALFALNHITLVRKVNYKILVGTLLALIILLFCPNIFGISNQAGLPLFQPNIQLFCLSFLLLYAILIGLLPRKNAIRIIKPILVCLLFIELAFMANTTVNKRDLVTSREMKSKVGYNDSSVDAVKYIHSIDTTFYRMQKTYGSGLAMHRSINDPLMQNFYGTTSYQSFNQSNYVRFLLATHVISPDLEGEQKEWATRWLNGLTIERPLLQIFGNVHYNLSKQPFTTPTTFLNDSITQIGDVYIYKNKFSLPFGYTYSHYMPRSVFDSLAFKDIALLEAVIVTDEDTEKYAALQLLEQPNPDKTYSFELLNNDLDSLKQEAFQMTYFSQNNIKGNITLNQNKLLFFTIPFDKGWKAFVNGSPVTLERVNIGFCGILLPSGTHELELRFEAPFQSTAFVVSWLSLLLIILLIIFNHRRFRSLISRN